MSWTWADASPTLGEVTGDPVARVDRQGPPAQGQLRGVRSRHDAPIACPGWMVTTQQMAAWEQ